MSGTTPSPPVAIITGSGRGIGRTYVVALLQRGWCVGMVDILDAEEAARVIAEEIGGDANKRLLAFTCDVTATTQIKQAMLKTKSHFGGLDLLVNNAAIYQILFTKVERCVAVNLTAVMKNTELFVQLATDSFKQRSEKPLLVVSTASSVGLIPADADMSPVYVATKFGVVGFTRSLKFLAPKFNIRVNCICPVTVDTLTGETDSEMERYLLSENRGGVMKPSACAEALLRIIDDTTLAGEAVVVHPSVGTKVEPLDPFGQFEYLGKWSFHKSKQTERLLDIAIEKVRSGNGLGWSCL